MLHIKKQFGVLLSCSLISISAAAQVLGPPEISVMDEAGINILTGLPSFNQTDIEIGSGVSKLTHSISSYDTGYFWWFRNSLVGGAGYHDGVYGKLAHLPGQAPQRFLPQNGGYTPYNQDGAILRQNSDNSWTYIAKDGTKFERGTTTYPNGFQITAHTGDASVLPSNGQTYTRIMSFTTNTGLQFKYTYTDREVSQQHYFLQSGTIGINNAYEYCDPIATTCSLTLEWPTSTYTWPDQKVMFAKHSEGATTAQAVFSVKDAKERLTSYVHKRFSKNSPNNLNIYFPPSYDFEGNADYVTRLTEIYAGAVSGEPIKKYTYQNFAQRFPSVGGGPGEGGWRYELRHHLVKEASVGNAVWTYEHNQPDTQYRSSGRSKGPRGNTSAVMALGAILPRKLSVYVPTAGALYNDDNPNLAYEAYENGYRYLYQYDSRGNVTQRTQVGKDGATDIVLTADYDLICNNLKTCNKPNWTKDGKGNQTDYEYHAESGQLLKVTGPADSNGIRPQTRYRYEQKYAWYKNASGNYVRAATPLWLLTREAFCKTSAATATGCSVAGDEVVTTYDYGPNHGPNNLFLRGVTVTADGKSQISCYDYDRFGNQIAETPPRANVASCY